MWIQVFNTYILYLKHQIGKKFLRNYVFTERSSTHTCTNQTTKHKHTQCVTTHICSYAAILDWGLGLALFLSSRMAVSLPDVKFDSDDGDIDPTPPVIDDTRILSEKFADTIFGCALASVNFLVYVGICMFPLVCDHGCSWRATFPSRPREPGRSNSCFLACPPVKGQGHICIMNYLNQ